MTTYTGTPADDNYTGGIDNDTISGAGGNDTLDGGDGDDTIEGNDGNDTISGGAGDDHLYGMAGDDLIHGGEGNDVIMGDYVSDSGGHNVVFGDNGDDTLFGGQSAVSVSGGAGDDWVFSAGNIDGGDGNDFLQVMVSGGTQTIDGGKGDDHIQMGWTFGSGTQIVHAGDGNDFIESAGDNVTIYGEAGNDTFKAAYSSYSLHRTYIGGTGDDTYYGGAGVTLVEAANEGSDTIHVGTDYVVPENFENLVLDSYGDFNLTGNAAINSLTGNDNNNILDGKAGADILIGMGGSDTYNIDDTGDTIVEQTYGGGTDTAIASVSYTLSANVENLTLTGAGSLSGKGNGGDNVITGNSGDNTLEGGAGNDTIEGGAGRDTAVFSGNQSAYAVLSSGGTITVIGPDGTDTLHGVELLRFADKTYDPVNGPVITGDLKASVTADGSYVLTAADLGFTDPDNASVTFAVSNLSHGTILVDGAAATSFTSAQLAGGHVAFRQDGSANFTAGFTVDASDGQSTSLSAAFKLDVTGLVVGHDTGEFDVVSTNADGVAGNGQSIAMDGTPDGRYVLFNSNATNFGSGAPAPYGPNHVYIKDTLTGEIRQADASQAGVSASQESYALGLSDDGTKVLFSSSAGNLGPSNTTFNTQVYMKDLTTGAVTLITANAAGAAGDAGAFSGVISPDGSLIFASSFAGNLGNGTLAPWASNDMYIRELPGPLTFLHLYSRSEGTFGHTTVPFDMSADGGKLLVRTGASQLTDSDLNGMPDLLVIDLNGGDIQIASAGPSGATTYTGIPTDGPAYISPDGTKVVFTSRDPSLSSIDGHGLNQVYLKDLTTGALTLLSADTTGQAGNRTSQASAFSTDGKTVYFSSNAALVPRLDAGVSDIFSYDLATGALNTLVAGTYGSTGGRGVGPDAVLFTSYGDLAADDTNFRPDAYVLHITGDDTLTGSDGEDHMFGKGGSDVLTGGKGNDVIDGGDGIDTAVFAGARADYTASVNGGVITLSSLTDGTDTVTHVEKFRFSDGTISAATLLSVTPQPNHAPAGAASAVLAHGTEDMNYVVSAASLLQGFSDADGDSLSLTGLTADVATVITNSDGTFTLRPGAHYNGPIALSYSVSDGQGGTVAAHQTVTLDAVNDAPYGHATASLSASEDTPFVVTTAQLVQGYTDLDGDSLSVTGLTSVFGTVTDNGDSTFTITPDANMSGGLYLYYSVSDGHGGSVDGFLAVPVAAVNDAPVAHDDHVSGRQNAALTITEDTLLANDSDVEPHGFNISTVGNAVNGTVTLSGGNVVFTPATGFTGEASFTYDLRDADGATARATVTVDVVPAPPPPPPPPPPPSSGFVRLGTGDDMASYAMSKTAVTVQGLGGNDGLTGSKYADSLNGGEGDDHLSGLAGRDTITGGKGADRMSGGADNDTFIFNAGDLASVGMDHIIDFHGAGKPMAAGGEQDFLRFQGFGAGATIVFDHYGAADHKLQVYHVTDPANGGNSGNILIQMADGTAQLAAGDYAFY